MSPHIDLPEEIEALSKKLAKDPSSRLFLPLAEKYRDAGFLDEAISVLQDGLKQHPTYTSAIFSLGRALHEKGDIDGALARFQEVIKTAPDNLLAHKKMAEIRLKKNLIPEALESLKMVLLLNPRDEEAQELVSKYQTQKETPKAAPDYGDVAIAGEPEVAVHSVAEPASTAASTEFLSGDDDADAYISGGPSLETTSEDQLETAIQPAASLEDSGIPLDLPDLESTSLQIEPEPAQEFTAETAAEAAPETAAYELPLPEEIKLDSSLGVEVPTTLTPVEGEFETQYQWAEPDVIGNNEEPWPKSDADALELPVYEITGEPAETEVKTPQPDETMHQLFSEIAGLQEPETADETAHMAQADESGTEVEPDTEMETETMADLYIQQGHYEDARGIYTRLLERNPEDAHLRQKLEELEFLISLLGQQE